MAISAKLRLCALITAAAAAAGMLAGCNNDNGTSGGAEAGTAAAQEQGAAPVSVSPEAREIADEYFAGDKSSFPAWSGIENNRLIASVDEPEHIPFFDITFGDFIGEYMYYLVNYGIEDDMSEDSADACSAYRVNIINYLTFEKMYLYAAEHDYGITPATLTKEQLDEVKNTAAAVRDDWEMTFYNAASEKLGENAKTEDIDRLCSEALDAVLEKCGIDYDMFYGWELNSKIQELTLEKLLENVKIEESDVYKEYSSLVQEAKDALEKDITLYESTPSYQSAYVPVGTRKARHIFISFPEDTVNAVIEAREKGNDYEADRLHKEALDNGLRQQAEDAAKELADGADFDELANKYSGEGEHIVLRNSPSYSEDYVGALYGIENAGGIAPLLITDTGIFIIQYTESAEISESGTSSLKEQIRQYLKNKADTDAQIEAYNRWTENFVYNIDCETLKVDESEIIRYGSAFSDIAG